MKTYEDGIADAVEMIDSLLQHEHIDGPVPTSLTLKLLKHTLLHPEEDEEVDGSDSAFMPS